MKPNIRAACAPCCTCPQPILQWDSVSASLSKCGFLMAATPGDPVRHYFLNQSAVCGAGSQLQTEAYSIGAAPTFACTLVTTPGDYSLSCCPVGWTGWYIAGDTDPCGTLPAGAYGWTKIVYTYHLRYDMVPGACNGYVQTDYTITYTLSTGPGGCQFSVVYNGTSAYSMTSLPPPEGPCECGVGLIGTANATMDPSTGAWSGTYTAEDGSTGSFSSDCYAAFWGGVLGCDEACGCPDPTNGGSYSCSGAVMPIGNPTYSNEYTTSMLETNTLAALPDFPGTWDGTPGSYRNLSADEITLSIRQSQYRFQFQPPKVGSGKCYQIASWVERFTPSDGSDPTDTVQGPWTWDGALPEGYDPTDSSTWPTSPEYPLAVPADNGTTTVGYYTDPDDPTTFVAGVPPAVCVGCDS